MKTVFIGMTIDNLSTSDYNTNVYEKFIEKGYRVVVITDGQKKELVNLESNPVILTWPSIRPTKLADALFFFKQLKIYRPSIVVSHFGSVNIMTLLSALFRVPVRVIWIHTLSTQHDKISKFLSFRKKAIHAFANQLIANSEAMKSDAMQNYKIEGEKIAVFPNALVLREVEGIQRDPKLIVYVGRLHISKGVDVLIEAFSKLIKENVDLKLKIVGSGEELENLMSLVQTLKLDRQVEFTGSLTKENVLQVFKEANFSVVPSRHEAFGYVVIEAMSLGTPVVGSNADGIAEIISDEEDGLLFKVGDSDELKSKMQKMINLLATSEKMRKMAYQTVNRRFNVDKVSLNIVEYLEKKLKENE